MTLDEFESQLIRSCNLVSEALDTASSLLQIYADDAALVTALPQSGKDAGIALQSIITALGTGVASNRAKINKLRGTRIPI